MKIVIANGKHSADYIIHKYHNRYNDLIVINNLEESCRYLSMNNDIPVMYGQATRESDLREAGTENADLFIALSKNDMENYVACQTAKKLLNVKRCISTVTNPKNVDLFKELGRDPRFIKSGRNSLTQKEKLKKGDYYLVILGDALGGEALEYHSGNYEFSLNSLGNNKTQKTQNSKKLN